MRVVTDRTVVSMSSRLLRGAGAVALVFLACGQLPRATDGGEGAGGGGGGSVIGPGGGATGGTTAGGSTETSDAGPPCVPASERPAWKTKVLFVVEASRAMCMVDPPGRELAYGQCEQVSAALGLRGFEESGRVVALRRFLATVKNRNDVETGVVTFRSTGDAVNFAGPSPILLQQTPIESALFDMSALGSDANLERGLTEATSVIENDLLRLTDFARTRTRYRIVVLSTGVPSPRCSANDGLMEYGSTARPELVWADTDPRCNGGEATISGFTIVPRADLNQSLRQVTDRLKLLSVWYRVPEIGIHTRLVLSAESITRCGALCDGQLTLGMNATELRTVGTMLMRQLATTSGGTFVDPGEPSALDLTEFARMEPATFCDE